MDKLVILGIDGLDYNLIKKFNPPSFSRLNTQRMESVVPILSCPAWPCMLTGKTPHELNIFDFIKYPSGELVDSQDWWSRSFFVDLDKRGITQRLEGIPFAYPPHKLEHGTVVPGYLGNPSKRAFIDISQKGKEAQVKDKALKVFDEEDKQLSSAPLDMDLTFLVYYSLDPVCHYFWKDMEQGGPYGGGIEEWYIEADIIIRNLLETNTNLIVVSDHGFGPYKKGLNVNRWLEELGYLTYREDPRKSMQERATDIILTLAPDYLKKVATNVLPKALIDNVSTRGKLVHLIEFIEKGVDWSTTVACSPFMSSGAIFTTTEEIAHNLYLELLKTGLEGRLSPYNPRLIIEPKDGLYPMNVLTEEQVWIDPPGWSASHTLDAVFATNMPAIKCERLTDFASIVEKYFGV